MAKLNFAVSENLWIPSHTSVVTVHALRLKLTRVDKTWVALKKLILIWKSDLSDRGKKKKEKKKVYFVVVDCMVHIFGYLSTDLKIY